MDCQGENEAPQEHRHSEHMMQHANQAGRQDSNDYGSGDGGDIGMGGTPNEGGNNGAEDDITVDADVHLLEEGIDEAQAQDQREPDYAIFKTGQEDVRHGDNPPVA